MQPIVGTLTDRSGSITTGGTAQQLAAALSYRRYFLLENISSGDLWVNFAVTAVQDQPSILILAGQALEFSLATGIVPNGLISIIGATTGQKFVAKEA